jgi:hypothetical protein
MCIAHAGVPVELCLGLFQQATTSRSSRGIGIIEGSARSLYLA